MFCLEIEGAHFIGGFARIVDLPAAALSTDISDATGLIEAEADIVAHMNEDHADALSLYATVVAKCAPGDWRMTGIDPEGIDLLHRSNSARIEFPTRVATPGDARRALAALAQQASHTRAQASTTCARACPLAASRCDPPLATPPLSRAT